MFRNRSGSKHVFTRLVELDYLEAAKSETSAVIHNKALLSAYHHVNIDLIPFGNRTESLVRDLFEVMFALFHAYLTSIRQSKVQQS